MDSFRTETKTVKVRVAATATLRSNDADGNDNVQKTIGLLKKDNNFARASRFFFFLDFFARFCTTTTWKYLISRFMENVTNGRRNYISLSELGYSHLKFSFTEGSPTFDKVSAYE